jgi:hypothetical protein
MKTRSVGHRHFFLVGSIEFLVGTIETETRDSDELR